MRNSGNKTAASAHGMRSGGLAVDAMAIGCLGIDRRGERFFVLDHFSAYISNGFENQRQYSNSRSKIKLRRTRVKNTPEGFALSLVGQIALADNKLSLSRALALSRSLALSLSVDTFSLSLSP